MNIPASKVASLFSIVIQVMVDYVTSYELYFNLYKRSKRIHKTLVHLQKSLKTLSKDHTEGSKTISKFLQGIGHNIPINKHNKLFHIV